MAAKRGAKLAESLPESATHWIRELKAGDSSHAAQKLWERFFQQLVVLGRQKLAPLPNRFGDSEQLALDVLNDCFSAIRAGRYPDLFDEHDLWQVLFDLLDKRATDQKRFAGREKRAWKDTVGESGIPAGPTSGSSPEGMAAISAEEPSPAFAAECADELQQLLECLGKSEPSGVRQRIAQLKLNGFKNREISDELRISLRTTERELRMIRAVWKKCFDVRDAD